MNTLWFSMAGSPAVWFAHFLAIWVLGEFGCETTLATSQIFGADAIKMLVMIATVIALPFTLTALFLAYRIFKESADERRLFMARAGVLSSAAFSFAIVFDVIPVFMLSSCGGVAGV